jgi:polyisoprenoid-binding protein YceI
VRYFLCAGAALHAIFVKGAGFPIKMRLSEMPFCIIFMKSGFKENPRRFLSSLCAHRTFLTVGDKMKFHLAKVGIALLLLCVAAAAQQKTAYSIDSAKSKLEIHVGKQGAFSAFGHDHLIVARQVSGEVQFDPQKIESSAVTLKVETKSLTVSRQDEPKKDVQDVQTTMSGEKVLDVAKFPEIVFTSTGVSAVKQTGDAWTLTLSGNLKLHGVEKPVRVPISLHSTGNQLHAQGEVPLLQTEYGIKPVKAGGGTVTVKDELKITFDIVAGK